VKLTPEDSSLQKQVFDGVDQHRDPKLERSYAQVYDDIESRHRSIWSLLKFSGRVKMFGEFGNILKMFLAFEIIFLAEKEKRLCKAVVLNLLGFKSR